MHALNGQRFGRWLVKEEAGRSNDHKVTWRCVCDCGNERIIRGSSLVSGFSKSCGCLSKDITIKRSTIHGDCRRGKISVEYRTWANVIRRCEDKEDKYYYCYGARGIKVCDRWRHDFSAFLEDMGRKPGKGYSIDRIDNDGNYGPGNCRWATLKEQANNRRNTRMLTYDGKTMCIADWAKSLGLNHSSLWERLQKWSIERALTVPARRWGVTNG